MGLRLVEEILERGIVVSCKTIRRWRKKFGPECVRRLRAKRPSPNDVWHLDEVLITIPGRNFGCGGLSIRTAWQQSIITAKLRSRGAEKRQVMPNGEHRALGHQQQCRESPPAAAKGQFSTSGPIAMSSPLVGDKAVTTASQS
ncbi:MAG: IS6 family transposase [Mesorhizobium sp.]|nr:MAG: IS6 family transposase [Mesorhizobium sp.]TIS27040.1 MAG: IS6 family transposase [Mesorhizobium sp.]